MHYLGFEQRKQKLVEAIRRRGKGHVTLEKDTSNLFRNKQDVGEKLDVRSFNHVLDVNTQEGWIDAEGSTPYEVVVDAALEKGVMPPVVPELRSITIGGALVGVGIEATSFRFGLMHETVLEAEVLLADGNIVVARPDNEYKDLFFSLPNSYGTFGYVLRVRVKAVPVKPYVKVSHTPYTDEEKFFVDIEQTSKSEVNFLDGVAFAPGELYASTGTFVDEAPYTSDYTYQSIYYKSIPERKEDYLSVRDYIWRWDTDWFWCSKNLGMQNPVTRALMGRKRLNSVTYTKIMRWNQKWNVTGMINDTLGRKTESVIQDVDIPVERAKEFLEWFHKEIGIRPMWICPIRHYNPDVEFSLYPMDSRKLYINFGFWDIVRSRPELAKDHFNRLVEKKVMDLGGIKSLYSTVHFTPEEFWTLYNKEQYIQMKQKYDPTNAFPNLYDRVRKGL